MSLLQINMVDRDSANNTTKLFMSKTPKLVYERFQVPRAGGTLNLIGSQVDTENVRESLNVYPATNIPTTFLQGSSTLQIQIPPSPVFLKHLRIEFTVSNGGTGQGSLLPVPFWLQSMQIQGNNGNIVLQQWQSQCGLFLSQIANIPDEQLMSISLAENINATDPSQLGPSAHIAAGATQKYVLGLEDGFWENVPLFMGDLNGNLIITLASSNLGAGDVGVTGGAPMSAITLTNCQALATVVVPSPDQLKYMSTQNIRDNQFIQQNFTQQQMYLSPGTQYTVKLSGSQGYCPWIWATTRGPLPYSSPALIRNWPDITQSIQINDSSGTPIVQKIDEYYISSFMAKDYWLGSQVFQQIGGVTQWSFSNLPSYVMKSAAVIGGYLFTSNEYYQFYTEPTMTAGTYEITIHTPIYSTLRITNGNFTLITS